MTEDIFKLISGAVAGFTGKIEGINKDKTLLPVRAAISGRAQAIKINFTDAENE
jgi:transcription antitermination factor NusG